MHIYSLPELRNGTGFAPDALFIQVWSRWLPQHVVSVITYDCSVRGLEESGDLIGFWTGEIDTWGKYTIQPVDGTKLWYLFPEEILAVKEYES